LGIPIESHIFLNEISPTVNFERQHGIATVEQHTQFNCL
jgi:hypothetical protein